jgi:adenosine kinase
MPARLPACVVSRTIPHPSAFSCNVVAQWVSGKPGLTVYSGCVGDDEYGRQLEAAARKDNVRVEYLKDATQPTGTCAVLIHEKERSLVANLGAANHYKISHLESPLMQAVVSQAKIFYSAGFFLTVSPDSMVAVGKHAAETGKIYMTNLSGELVSSVPRFVPASQRSPFRFSSTIFAQVLW